MRYEIEVFPKKDFTNLHGAHILSDIMQACIKGIKKVEYSPVYAIDGINKTEAALIGKELLSDKITETFSIDRARGKEKAGSIEVWFKKGVTDTVSESVEKAIKDLGINKEVKVKTGHIYYIYGAVNKQVLEKIATEVLANTLIQDYKINELL